ncbi:hypothetical protein Sjap_011096 [Stephania japonica]|uniref:Uncharacterized protein n=1 Tax=Stephania japonica TaxID=461633 RepID=A0AAP0JAX8_9MAGN
MEEHERWYLHALLSRASEPDQRLRHFLNYIRESEGQAQASYAEPVNLSSDEFVEMILLDACFAIELFYNYGRVELRNDNDPIYITSCSAEKQSSIASSGDDEELVSIIKQLSKGLVVSRFFFAEPVQNKSIIIITQIGTDGKQI